MPPGADLFIVCKQCGSEVSPYITECPYCGSRLRRRAPKLPRAHPPSRTSAPRGRLSALLTRSPGARPAPRARPRPARASRFGTRPNATIALVALGALAWVARHAEPQVFVKTAILGPLDGEWWRLLTSAFAYLNGFYAFLALLVVAIFGWLLEQRHGPITVLALFAAASVSGALVELAVYPAPVVTGANAAALALLGAWASPDLSALRAGDYYEGDLLGACALGGLLLAIPFALVAPEVSWLSGATGLALGLLAGLGLARTSSRGA